jgi:hypothetical protein
MRVSNTHRSCPQNGQYRLAVRCGLLLGLGHRQVSIVCRLSPSSDSALGPRKPQPRPTLFPSSSWTDARSTLASVLPAFRQQRAHHACRLSPAAGDQPHGRASSPRLSFEEGEVHELRIRRGRHGPPLAADCPHGHRCGDIGGTHRGQCLTAPLTPRPVSPRRESAPPPNPPCPAAPRRGRGAGCQGSRNAARRIDLGLGAPRPPDSGGDALQPLLAQRPTFSDGIEGLSYSPSAHFWLAWLFITISQAQSQ